MLGKQKVYNFNLPKLCGFRMVRFTISIFPNCAVSEWRRSKRLSGINPQVSASQSKLGTVEQRAAFKMTQVLVRKRTWKMYSPIDDKG